MCSFAVVKLAIQAHKDKNSVVDPDIESMNHFLKRIIHKIIIVELIGYFLKTAKNIRNW